MRPSPGWTQLTTEEANTRQKQISMARARLSANGSRVHSVCIRPSCTSWSGCYGWFTEGFDTLNLKEAKSLLDKPVQE
jgi:hypothetical protein